MPGGVRTDLRPRQQLRRQPRQSLVELPQRQQIAPVKLPALLLRSRQYREQVDRLVPRPPEPLHQRHGLLRYPHRYLPPRLVPLVDDHAPSHILFP